RAFAENLHFLFVKIRHYIGDLPGAENVEVPEKIDIGRSDLKHYEIRFQRLPMREKLNPHICQSMAGHAEWNHLWMKIGTLLFEESFQDLRICFLFQNAHSVGDRVSDDEDTKSVRRSGDRIFRSAKSM